MRFLGHRESLVCECSPCAYSLDYLLCFSIKTNVRPFPISVLSSKSFAKGVEKSKIIINYFITIKGQKLGDTEGVGR